MLWIPKSLCPSQVWLFLYLACGFWKECRGSNENEMLTTQRLAAKLENLTRTISRTTAENHMEKAILLLYFNHIFEARTLLLDAATQHSAQFLSESLRVLSFLACALARCSECRRSIRLLSRLGDSAGASAAAAVPKAAVAAVESATDGAGVPHCVCGSGAEEGPNPFDCAAVPIFHRAARSALGVHFLPVGPLRSAVTHGWTDYAAALEDELMSGPGGEVEGDGGGGGGGGILHTVTTLLYLPVGPAAALRLTRENLRRILRAAPPPPPAATLAPLIPGGRHRLRIVHLVRPAPPPVASFFCSSAT